MSPLASLPWVVLDKFLVSAQVFSGGGGYIGVASAGTGPWPKQAPKRTGFQKRTNSEGNFEPLIKYILVRTVLCEY